MRVLMTILPGATHLDDVLPLAQCLRLRGHDVRVCAPASLSRQIQAFNLKHFPAGKDWVDEILQPLTTAPEISIEEMMAIVGRVLQGFVGEPALCMAEDVKAHCSRSMPDMIVRDAAEFGGYLAAESLELPHVSVGGVAGCADFLQQGFVQLLNALRQQLGLDTDPDGYRIFGYLHANLLPESFDLRESALPNTRSYRLEPIRPYARLPHWISEISQDNRPLALLSFGTTIPTFPAYDWVMQEVIAGVENTDCFVIISAGRGRDPNRFGKTPPNVRIVEFVAQPTLLEVCDLFINHGGYGSVREGIRHGVPMLLIPIGVDNYAGASRCEDLGVGRVLRWETLKAEDVNRACTEVLADARFRTNALDMQRRCLMLPPVEVLADQIESIGVLNAWPETTPRW